MMDQIAELLRRAGIALSGYTADEIEDAMADGIVWPEPEDQAQEREAK